MGRGLDEKSKSDIKKYVISGTMLIIIFLALMNINSVLSFFVDCVGIVMPFIIGGVIAFILNVPMRAVEKHLFKSEKYQTNKMAGIRRGLAYIITLILIIAILTVVIFVVVPQLVETIANIVQVVPGEATKLYNWILSQASKYPQVEEQLKAITINWNTVLQKAGSFLTEGTKGLINGGIGAVSGIISGVTTSIIAFIFSIYILLQKEKLTRQFKKILYAVIPMKKADKTVEILRISNSTFSNFLSGQCLEACILGSMFIITMLIFRFPYAVLIGVLIAVTALIPIVGAFIGCIVGFILIALLNPIKGLMFIVLFLILQQIEGNLIYPHVVGNSVGLPSIWVLVAVTVGGNLFGIVGMLTFIPICSICYALFRTFINRRVKDREIPDDRFIENIDNKEK